MSKSLIFPILLLFISSSSLLLSTQALNPIQKGSYFYIPRDNHLSHELYQTPYGTIAHSIEPADKNSFSSTYALINLDTKDAIAILSDLVRLCDIPNPIFQSLHYHNQTDSLVYYCAKNSSLLILNQQDQTIQSVIPFNLQTSLPVAKLSTDGTTSIAILLMDSLFTESPQNSVLLKVNLQTKKLTAQISFNKNLKKNEAVVAYAANKKHTYIATNLLQGNDLTTTVYSLAFTAGNTYQLTKITTLDSSITSYKIITKLFTLKDYIVVSSGKNLHFFDQKGSEQEETEILIKPLNNQINGLYHSLVTSQFDGANLYAVKNLIFTGVSMYSVAKGTLQSQEVLDMVSDFQVAFGNPATSGSDLIFIPYPTASEYFYIIETKNFSIVYKTIAGYSDLVLTNTTYAVIRPLKGLYEYPAIYIFNLTTNAFKKNISISERYHSNKDQKIISYLYPILPDLCYFVHTNITTGEERMTSQFTSQDPIFSSYPVFARLTEKGHPEAVFQTGKTYEIISETLGRQSFPTTSNTDSINVNFDNDLSLYYLSANQTANQVTASLYALNPLTKNFSRISTNTLDNRPVENQGFFISNQSTTFALSNNSFAVINKLNSVWSQEKFPNTYNMLTTFNDNTNTQFTFFGYNNSQLAKGLPPLLFSSHSEGFVPIPGERPTTVNGIVTGTNSYALHDDLGAIGVVRFYAEATTKTELISM